MNKLKSIIVCKSKADGWKTHKHMKALGVHMGNEEADDLNHKKIMCYSIADGVTLAVFNKVSNLK